MEEKESSKAEPERQVTEPQTQSDTLYSGIQTGSTSTELRIVLLEGRRSVKERSGKSQVGNIILGRDVYDIHSYKTSKSVVRQALVSGRQVTVVNTPGWRSNFPLDLTPKLRQLEIRQSVRLCPPGPHAFVLVVRLDVTPFEGAAKSAEEHMGFLLGDRVWKLAIVVFTVTDKNKQSCLPMAPDLIRSDHQLRYLVEKCGGRFHVLNITDMADRGQVTELLEVIDQMVTSNGGHYEAEEHVSEELVELERTIARNSEQRAEKQRTGRPKHTGPTEQQDLRILLLGRDWSGKSSAGNLILGGSSSPFKVSGGGQRSVRCSVRQGEAAGRRVMLVESPGWLRASPVGNTSQMDKLEIQDSVSLCPPGPHAVLLAVSLDKAFTKAQRVSLEEHVELLSQRVWSYALVLFTKGDYLGDASVEQHIEAEGEDLRWLVHKCGNRYHVLDAKHGDDTQVTELLEKLEEMVAGNRGEHYVVHGYAAEKVKERKTNVEERVHTLRTTTHRQRTALKALFEGELQSPPELRVLLVGGEELQRTRAGNYILQEYVFPETPFKEFKSQTKLTECVRQQRRVADRTVSVVICPDWSTTTPPSQETKDVLLHGVDTLCSPGLHAVLLTVPVRSSFSEADRRSVEEHMELLGDRVWRHALVLFTFGYWLGGRPVEEYIESEGEPLRWILEKCGYRYHVIDFHKLKVSETVELMEMIDDMVTRNRGHYTPSLQVTPFQSVREKLTDEEKNSLDEEWKRREEEMIQKMMVFMVKEQPLPAVRRRRESFLHLPPSMSGGTPSETGSSHFASPKKKVSDWLEKGSRRPTTSSSGVETMSLPPSLADSDTREQQMAGQWRGPQSRPPVVCSHCGRQGHVAWKCRAKYTLHHNKYKSYVHAPGAQADPHAPSSSDTWRRAGSRPAQQSQDSDLEPYRHSTQ